MCSQGVVQHTELYLAKIATWNREVHLDEGQDPTNDLIIRKLILHDFLAF